jgi:hypothetical protein
MKSFEQKPTLENLKITFLNDSVGRTEDVCSFVKMLSSIEGAFSLGIDGKWGTGKTFFIKQAKLVLDSLNPNVPSYSMKEMEQIRERFRKVTQIDLQEFPPVVTAYYDAWQHDEEEDPILSLVYEIMKDNRDNKYISKKRDWTEILSSIAEVLSDRNIGDLIEKCRGKDIFENIKDNEKLYEIINNFFVSLLPEKGNRLVVFIDELDRCMPIFAVKLLERIKHYFLSDCITFVFSINSGELENTIRSYYGEGFDACRYMDRFFDLRMQLPPIDMKKYYEYLGGYGSRNMRETVCTEVIRQMDLGMREASRFLYMTKIAAYKYTDSDSHDNYRRYSHDDGISDLICFCVIVPIALGLKMTNSTAFEDFIMGRNYVWLERILTSEVLSDWVTNYFLCDNESYKQTEGKTLVSKNMKIQEVYQAVFVKTYENVRDFRTQVGKAVFEKGLKDSILKAIGFVSPYTDYSIESGKR